MRMCCQFPRKGHGQEHLASSFHCFSSRSTQKQPPDTFTFGPTQSDPTYPRKKGLQERTQPSTSQGSETSGSLRRENSARAALNHSQEGLWSSFSSHQLLQDTPRLTLGSSSGITRSRAWQMSHVSLVNSQVGLGRVQAFPALLVAFFEKYSFGLWPFSFVNMSVNP